MPDEHQCKDKWADTKSSPHIVIDWMYYRLKKIQLKSIRSDLFVTDKLTYSAANIDQRNSMYRG